MAFTIPALDFSRSASAFIEDQQSIRSFETTATSSTFASITRINNADHDASLPVAHPSSRGKLCKKRSTLQFSSSAQTTNVDDSCPQTPLRRWSTHMNRIVELCKTFETHKAPTRAQISAPISLPGTPDRGRTPDCVDAATHPASQGINTSASDRRPEKEPHNSTMTFRCDIDAASGFSYREIEAGCRQKIIDAHGRILDDILFVGGFLYEVSADAPSPLSDATDTQHDGRIQILPWQVFPEPRLDGLRMHPVKYASMVTASYDDPDTGSDRETQLEEDMQWLSQHVQ